MSTNMYNMNIIFEADKQMNNEDRAVNKNVGSKK